MSYAFNECNKCGEKYSDVRFKWCKSCHINSFKNNFTRWTSGNKKIDNYIQEMQLKIDKKSDIVFICCIIKLIYVLLVDLLYYKKVLLDKDFKMNYSIIYSIN